MSTHLPVLPPDQADPDLPGGAFSHSQYDCYKSCPRSYCKKYIEKIPTAGSPSLARGSAIHMAAEMALKHIRDKKTMPEWEQQVTVLHHTYDKKAEEIEDWGEESKDKHREATLGMYHVYHAQALPKLNPVEVEVPFIGKLGTVVVRGIIDLIDHERENPADPGKYVIVDLKTSASKWSESDVKNDTQLTLYSAVQGHVNGRIDNLVSTKTPALHRLPTTRTPRDVAVLKEDYEETVDLIKRGIFPRTSIDSWKCTKKWCSYWLICRGRQY